MKKSRKKPSKFQYFSKWRKQWIDFVTDPSPKEFAELLRYNYNIREKGKI